MTPQDLIDDLRSRINPAYAAQLGTESYERRMCAEALEALISERDWHPIETAPHDKRVMVWSGQEMYCAHWAQNPMTGDEAWIVAEWGTDGDQALVKPTHWQALPLPPNALGEGRERGILREASSGEAATSTDGLEGKGRSDAG